MKTKTWTLMGLFFCLAAVLLPAGAASEQPITATDVYVAGPDFAQGTHDGTAVAARGLTLAGDAVTGRYVSPVLEAPQSFNTVVPQWLTQAPEAASLTIRLRTSPGGGRWSEWRTVEVNDDWTLPGSETAVGQMTTVPAADVTHHAFQFSVSFSRYTGRPAAVLQQLRLTFIDSTNGPTAAELAPLAQQPPQSPGEYPKPPVVGRSVWCTDPACNYSGGLVYVPVTHLIVHHTATGNDPSDWPAVVRAIWFYHTVTLGWGDIGYHYLVDPTGVIYEGHLGGDDVVGVHAGPANSGSMGVALLGTFTRPEEDPPGIPPPPTMLPPLAELLAWKADQKDINVYDAGYLPNVAWGLPYLMGHRDVDGLTVCPGDQMHVLLPWLRNEVAGRIGYVPPHQYVDELSGAFTKSNGNWLVPPGGCGFGGHAYYAWSTTDPGNATYWGEWRPPVSAAGWYEVEVYAPYCYTGAPETGGATYQVSHLNGVTTVVVNHNANVGAWMSLGAFEFAAGNSGKIRLTNLTTTDSGLGVWFDAIRLRPLAPAATNLQPPPEAWLNNRTVNFHWSLANPAAISAIQWQVANDAGFTNLVATASLPAVATSYNHTFAQDYGRLYWRVVLTTTQNHTITSQPTAFGLDATAPTSAVQAIYLLPTGRYVVAWQGSDALSGVAAYNVEYRAQGETAWTPWLTGTPATSALFIPPDGQVYWFRSQAVDAAGNIEPPHSSGDLSTNQALFLPHAIMLPLVKQ
ncbi:MAG: N-acetylmuramoyl-L-alanine amidase [Chloroflexi bacterium]|nr:N-acetylmuramoyl-L-alanine amidase [Chloroflexota bacterium]MCI0578736.1 N-acetylmuramoyl-L-alanine amidase [Chloroflexota bacterium]MCI0643979.1 N-acetylmuramoyl-L-alanine amidase [Chloroflexota bacterium]MCI0732022.1 N-acetylmuramoyl-L-alanine amidase [Chloroflexota bacterium]